MKAAIIGYGKMGREIEKILIQRGHEVALIIDIDNASDLNPEKLKDVDVAIEFTTPTGNFFCYFIAVCFYGREFRGCDELNCGAECDVLRENAGRSNIFFGFGDD